MTHIGARRTEVPLDVRLLCVHAVNVRSRKGSHKADISKACAHEHQDSHMATNYISSATEGGVGWWKWMCGGKAHRAEAAARHQGESKHKGKNWGVY